MPPYLPYPDDAKSHTEPHEAQGVLRCPSCKTPLTSYLSCMTVCEACGFSAPCVDGIPILLRDVAVTEQKIEGAKNLGRREWYEAHQLCQWQGPYRHHLWKRRQYVAQRLTAYREHRSERRIVGLDLGCGDGANLSWITA